MMERRQRLGIIDLGSNSSRLSIYDIRSDGAYRPVFEMKQNVRLAHSLSAERVISADGIDRAVACTRSFLNAGALYDVTRWLAVATAAIRQAANRQEVLARLEADTALRFRVLSGEEEGYYGYLGAVSTLDLTDALLLDIGGASSEMMCVRQRQLAHVVSIPYGSLTLTEMFRDQPEAMVAQQVRELLCEHLQAIPWLAECRQLPLVGLGGTARAVAKVHAARQSERMVRLHGYTLHAEFVRAELTSLSRLSLAKRKKVKGLSKSRAELIVAGFAVITAVIDAIETTTLLVSRNGLREGLFFEQYLGTAPIPSVLEHSIRNFQRIFQVELRVAECVCDMACWLFDQLIHVHQLSAEDRRLLWATAQVESCGSYVNTERWSRHSAYLAMSAHLNGLTTTQLTDLADLLYDKGVARIHQLHVLLRLGKLLALQLGVRVDELGLSTDKTAVALQYATDLTAAVRRSADPEMETLFETTFGRKLIFRQAQ